MSKEEVLSQLAKAKSAAATGAVIDAVGKATHADLSTTKDEDLARDNNSGFPLYRTHTYPSRFCFANGSFVDSFDGVVQASTEQEAQELEAAARVGNLTRIK